MWKILHCCMLQMGWMCKSVLDGSQNRLFPIGRGTLGEQRVLHLTVFLCWLVSTQCVHLSVVQRLCARFWSNPLKPMCETLLHFFFNANPLPFFLSFNHRRSKRCACVHWFSASAARSFATRTRWRSLPLIYLLWRAHSESLALVTE